MTTGPSRGHRRGSVGYDSACRRDSSISPSGAPSSGSSGYGGSSSSASAPSWRGGTVTRNGSGGRAARGAAHRRSF